MEFLTYFACKCLVSYATKEILSFDTRIDEAGIDGIYGVGIDLDTFFLF